MGVFSHSLLHLNLNPTSSLDLWWGVAWLGLWPVVPCLWGREDPFCKSFWNEKIFGQCCRLIRTKRLWLICCLSEWIHTWRYLCVSFHLHPQWRVIHQSKARTLIHQGSTSPLTEMHRFMTFYRIKIPGTSSDMFDLVEQGQFSLIKLELYLVMSRLSSFNDFWSHIFNSATNRKSSFDLIRKQNKHTNKKQ